MVTRGIRFVLVSSLLFLVFGCATTQPKMAVDSASVLPGGQVTFTGKPLSLTGTPIRVGEPLPSVKLTDAMSASITQLNGYRFPIKISTGPNWGEMNEYRMD